MKKFTLVALLGAVLGLLVAAPQIAEALDAAAKYDLNNKMGAVARRHQLGTLIESAENSLAVLANSETITNGTDDTVTVASEDEAIILRLEGFEAKASTLTLAADQGDDAGDEFSLSVSTSDVLAVKNESTNLLQFTTTGVMTLPNEEVLDAVTTDDTIQFMSNDAATNLQVAGFEAQDAVLSIWADQGDDSADKFSFTVAAAGGLTLKQDATSLATVSTAGDWAFLGTTPYLTIGDAGAEDAGLAFDGNAQDFHISLDDSADKLVIGLGTAAGTTDRMAFNSADLNIVLGDATAADVGFIYNGNAQDYNISLDDSTDDLVIGLGSTAGTTDAIRIDENQDVTIVQGLIGLGTDELVGFLQNQVASTTTSATAAQCGSTFVSNSADTITLPEASTVLGCRYTFVCGTADDFVVNPADATDTIGTVVSVTGTNTTTVLAPAAGDSITCTDIGSSIVLEAVGANLWVSIGAANGIWTDTN